MYKLSELFFVLQIKVNRNRVSFRNFHSFHVQSLKNVLNWTFAFFWNLNFFFQLSYYCFFFLFLFFFHPYLSRYVHFRQLPWTFIPQFRPSSQPLSSVLQKQILAQEHLLVNFLLYLLIKYSVIDCTGCLIHLCLIPTLGNLDLSLSSVHLDHPVLKSDSCRFIRVGVEGDSFGTYGFYEVFNFIGV